MNGKYLNLLKTKKNNSLKDFLAYENKNRTIYNTPKRKSIPIVTGYFPIDFSLNIYKSTDLYKKRYQIEPLRLKQQLKLVKIQKKSKKSEKIIKSFKKSLVENTFSSDLLRLIKSNKIDRFAKRYLEKKTNVNININNYINKKIGRVLSSKKINDKEDYKQIDEDKFYNDDVIKHKIFIPFKDIKSIESQNFSEENMLSQNSESKFKSNVISSSSQTSNINKYEEKKISDEKHKIITRPLSHSILKNDYLFDSLKSYNNIPNTPNIEKFTHKKIRQRAFTKKFLILDKNMNIKLFSPKKSQANINNNIIKHFENNRKLIFSFYDPNDKHIQLLREFEKKLKRTNTEEKNIIVESSSK